MTRELTRLEAVEVAEVEPSEATELLQRMAKITEVGLEAMEIGKVPISMRCRVYKGARDTARLRLSSYYRYEALRLAPEPVIDIGIKESSLVELR